MSCWTLVPSTQYEESSAEYEKLSIKYKESHLMNIKTHLLNILQYKKGSAGYRNQLLNVTT